MNLLNQGKLRFTAALAVATCILSLGNVYPVSAQNSRTYKDIEENEFNNCIKNAKTNRGWTEYNGGNTGTIMIKSNEMPGSDKWIASVRYDYKSSRELLWAIEDKRPVIVSEGDSWEGFDNTVKKCGGTPP